MPERLQLLRLLNRQDPERLPSGAAHRPYI
jgi:hypothetical protein